MPFPTLQWLTRLSRFAYFSLMMCFTMVVPFVALADQLASRAVEGDADLSARLRNAHEQLTNGSEAFRNNESDLQELFNQLKPVLERTPWMTVALCSSLLIFSLVGLLYVRFTGQAQWAGLFPLVAILSGQSPSSLLLALASRGVSAAEISFPQHLLILLVQMASVYGSGWLGLQLHRRANPL